MRRYLFPALGLIELAAAAALAALGASLPAERDVAEGFAGARRVTAAAGEQVRALRGQVDAVRRSNLRQAAGRLQASGRSVAAAVKAQGIDFDRVRTLRDVMGRSARGLSDLAGVFDPGAMGKLGAGLGEAADFLDRGVVPAATAAADALEAAADPLEATARRLARLAHEAPLDLKPLREVHDSLARFDEGLAATSSMLDPRRLEPLRQAAGGAEGVVTEAARMAERASGYSFPVVTFEGIKPRVKAQPFWPKGAEVGADLRKVADGVAATGRELDALSRELPRVQAAVVESRKALGATRKTMAAALSRQDEVDRLLKEMPAQADRLAAELPKLTGGLTKALRATGRLGAAAESLRKARRGVDAATERLPETKAHLEGSAAVLAAARDQLDGVLRRRGEYEAAASQVDALTAELAALTPALAGGLADRADGEDGALAEVERGVAQIHGALPAYDLAVSRCLRAGRVLAWLVAAVAALHGGALLAGGPRGPEVSS